MRSSRVASHRDAASLGPEGYPIDWHGVRAFYRMIVDPKEHLFESNENENVNQIRVRLLPVKPQRPELKSVGSD